MSPFSIYRTPDIRRLMGVLVVYLLLSLATMAYFSWIGMVIPIVRPDTGFALGVLLLWGPRYWPATFIAAMLAKLWLGYTLWGALLVGAGVSLGAGLGAWLLTRDKAFDPEIPSFRDFGRLLLWAGLIGASVSAITGTVAAHGAGLIDRHAFANALVRGWMGDALGVLVIAPLLLVWRVPPGDWLGRRRLIGVVLYFFVSFLAGQAIFLGWFTYPLGKVALGYWMFLFVVWGAARFGPHSVVIVLLMVLVQALWGSALGVGFFASDIARTQLSNVWFYLVALSTVGMGLASTVTAFKRVEQEVRDLAHHDPLTGLPNRLLLSDRIGQAIATAKRERHRMAVIFHDLDNFKPVNDAYGHRVGDLLLKEVAGRVQESVRRSDTVGRVGGDEFVIVLPMLEDVRDATQVAEKIHDALLRPFVIEGNAINISTSIGIALYPEHGETEATLTGNADNAMYFAKQNGRNNIQVYAVEMSNSVDRRAGPAARRPVPRLPEPVRGR